MTAPYILQLYFEFNSHGALFHGKTLVFFKRAKCLPNVKIPLENLYEYWLKERK